MRTPVRFHSFFCGMPCELTLDVPKSGTVAAVGGVIDVEGSEEVRADLFALQTFGLPTATFGEIRERADLLLLWRCDPRLTHRHLFEVPPRPALTGAPERAVVVVPAAGHPSAPTTDPPTGQA